MSSGYIPKALRRRLRSESGRRCAYCRSSEAVDPATGEAAPLFNPRTQAWHEHFQWSRDGSEIAGLTPSGRATVEALRLNNEEIVAARLIWIAVGLHPPSE